MHQSLKKDSIFYHIQYMFERSLRQKIGRGGVGCMRRGVGKKRRGKVNTEYRGIQLFLSSICCA